MYFSFTLRLIYLNIKIELRYINFSPHEKNREKFNDEKIAKKQKQRKRTLILMIIKYVNNLFIIFE